MNNNQYSKLIQRARGLERCNPLSMEEIIEVERILNITLPNSFKELCVNCSYEYMSSFEFYSFDNVGKYSLISQNLAFREAYALPKEYLCLAVEDDISVVLMRITSAEDAQVIWCAMEDFMNLLEGRPMEYNPTIFNSFVDFYEFLLDREEEIRNTEAN